jgi:pyroglutamyl-peptidase
MSTTTELPKDSNYQDPWSNDDDNNNNGVEEQKQDRSSTTNCKFIISGFGPFGSVKENPTTIIVTKLCSFLKEQRQKQKQQCSDEKDSSRNTSNKYKWLLEMIDECVLLETSANNVNETLSKFYTKLVNTTTTTTTTKTNIIFLHLGVDENSTTFKLEKCAYNEATFRIPDEKGYQPTKEKIFHDLELNDCITTKLDIEFLYRHMKKLYPSMATKISIDPGRYVCNYVYCNSLQRFGSINDDDGNNNNNNNSDVCCYSLFLHVPPFTVISEEKQLEYVVSLLEALARSTETVIGDC